jgi:hypothetical protein
MLIIGYLEPINGESSGNLTILTEIMKQNLVNNNQ